MKSDFQHVKSQILLLCILYGSQSQRLNNFKVIKPERVELRKFQTINDLSKVWSKIPALLGILKLIWLRTGTSDEPVKEWSLEGFCTPLAHLKEGRGIAGSSVLT